MRYTIRIADGAERDMRKLSRQMRRRVTEKLERLADGLTGDVKRLRDFTPAYRLRVGDWRVLFDVEGDTIMVHHVSHRSQAYD